MENSNTIKTEKELKRQWMEGEINIDELTYMGWQIGITHKILMVWVNEKEEKK